MWYPLSHDTTFFMNLTSKVLQIKESDLNSATRQMTKIYILRCRSAKKFEQAFVDDGEISKELKIPPFFETEQLEIGGINDSSIMKLKTSHRKTLSKYSK